MGVANDTLVAFAMTGTTASFPAGYNASTGAVTRIEPAIGFDVAFDLADGNKVRLVPARLVSAIKLSFAGPVATQQVGLQTSSSTFEAITKAPSTGYKRDSVVVVDPGQPVIIEVNSDVCQFTISNIYYAKIVVDSVNRSSRQIFFRATRDPNCGFRSFLPGVPKS